MGNLISDFNLACGEEAFIVYPKYESLEESDFKDVEIFDSSQDLADHLLKLDAIIDGPVNVIHGVLTTAEALPDNIQGLTPYIALVSHYSEAIIFESRATNNSIELLEEDIIRILNKAHEGKLIKNDFDFDIENIFVLYGYNIDTKITIDEDDLDEESIERGKKVHDVVDGIIIENKI